MQQQQEQHQFWHNRGSVSAVFVRWSLQERVRRHNNKHCYITTAYCICAHYLASALVRCMMPSYEGQMGLRYVTSASLNRTLTPCM